MFVTASLPGPPHAVPAATHFECQLMVLDLLDHKSIFTAGYKCVLHIHTGDNRGHQAPGYQGCAGQWPPWVMML